MGHYSLGLGVAALARGVRTSLQAAALPRLNALVAQSSMTAFLVVRAGDEAVTVTRVAAPATPPRTSRTAPAPATPSTAACPAALLMPEPPAPGDRPELQHARQIGWGDLPGQVVPWGCGRSLYPGRAPMAARGPLSPWSTSTTPPTSTGSAPPSRDAAQASAPSSADQRQGRQRPYADAAWNGQRMPLS